MQAEHTGPFLYIYSGRAFLTKEPDRTKVGQEDPFSKVECVRIDSITSVVVDHKDFTITLWTGARPIHCSFGDRNCYKINCFHAFLDVLAQCLHLPPQNLFDLGRRNEQTALSVQRGDAEDSE